MKKGKAGSMFCIQGVSTKLCFCAILQFLVTLGLFVSPLLAASPQLVLPDSQSISFQEMDKLLAGDGDEYDRFGDSVAISGETVVIGSPINDGNGDFSGSAYIFQRSGGVWSQVQKLTAGDGDEFDNFGDSVAISGETVVVGSHFDDDNGSSSGSAYIFTRSDGVWSQVQKLTADDGGAGDYFGDRVAINGETVVIGSFGDDDNGLTSGSAYIFTKSGDVWSQVQKLTADDGAAEDYFGASVAINGETVVIGSRFDDDKGSDSGSAYIFTRSDGVWSQVQKLTADDGVADDYFGISVAISGETVVLGSYGDDDNGYFSGSAYIFTRSDGVWSQMQKLTADDGVGYDYFGASVAISGETVVIGSRFDDDKGSDSGSAYIFTRSDGVWIQVQKLTAGDGVAGDQFGTSAAISDETVVIGSYLDDDNGFNSGSAYIFEELGLLYNSLEGKRHVIYLDAADSNSDYPISFSLLSGLDEPLFTLDSSGLSSALLQFATAPDFEAPADSNGDNLYELYLQLVDTANEVNTYRVSVRVGDIPYEQTLPRALTYQELQKLQASLPIEGDRWRSGVAINGETAVVAAGALGRAYVYVYNDSSGLYEHKADLRPNVAGDTVGFGQDVAVSGDTIAVVDPWINSYTGGVYIFEKPADGWSGAIGETALLTGSDSAVNDYFGTSVAMSGETLVVGVHADDDSGSCSGSAYLFQKVNDVWIEMAKFTASDGAGGDMFGVSVTIIGDTVVVGSFLDDIDGVDNAGSVYLYERPYQGWVTTTENAKLMASDGEEDAQFGLRVDISGDVVVVGTDSSLTAYLFEKPLTGWNGTLTEDAILSPSVAVDSFGPAVAIERDLVVVGATGDDKNGEDAGAIYLFEKPTGGWSGTVNETTKFTSANVAGDFLGAGVAIDQSVIFATASGDDATATNSGAAYVLQGRFLPGDVDNSATVELTDTITALQVMTGSVSAKIVTEADVNGDEKIGIPEAMFSLKAIAEEL